MSEKSSGGIEFTPEKQDASDIAVNPTKLAAAAQQEKPKPNGRFIIAMIPAKKAATTLTEDFVVDPNHLFVLETPIVGRRRHDSETVLSIFSGGKTAIS